ncbi:unnamed protein product [Lathyrus sativus]|nr:unnamed protein product [Lathyrus sativus]
MAKGKKEKFDKYWSEYSVTLAFENVLDPTSKLEFLNFCFKKLEPSGYEDKEYHQEKIQNISNDRLEIYLDEKCLDDILQYEKLNSVQFPQLAIMACEILSISITTVPRSYFA